VEQRAPAALVHDLLLIPRASSSSFDNRTEPSSSAVFGWDLTVGVRLLSLVGNDAVFGAWVDQLVVVTTELGFRGSADHYLAIVPWAVVGHLVGSSAIGVSVTGVGRTYIAWEVL
jgi:hypothetical protein